MEKHFKLIQSIQLFDGIDAKDLMAMLSCLDAAEVEARKGMFVLAAGQKVNHVGVVLEGQLHIIKEDINGERVLIATLEPGDIFAEVLCFAGVPESPVSVVADIDSQVLQLGFRRMLETCGRTCVYHTRLIENMLHIIARKNLQLQSRMDFLSKKSIRAKLMSYFEAAALRQGRAFEIPLNREELADFLCIDRSALSRELGNLKREGILEYHKNRFRLL